MSASPKQLETPDPAEQIANSGGMRFALVTLLIFGGLAALCIVAGLFFRAGALALFFFVILLTSAASLGCVGGGAYAIYRGAVSQTRFSILGVELNTRSVGVAFMGIGMIIGYFTFKAVLDKVGNLQSAEGTSGVWERLSGPTASAAFDKGSDARDLEGLWEVQLYEEDSNGKERPYMYQDKDGKSAPYPPEKIKCTAWGSVVMFNSTYSSGEGETFWGEGRLSPGCYLT